MTALIAELVEKFSHNFAEYKNPKYNETQVRVEFVNPFWELLGWDVNNISGKSLTYRDVIQRQITSTDAQIDKLVYELYGLTEEEIKVVEGV